MIDILIRVLAAVLTAIAVGVIWRWVAHRDTKQNPRIVKYGRTLQIFMGAGSLFFGVIWIGCILGVDRNDPMYVVYAVGLGFFFGLLTLASIEAFRRRIDISDRGLHARLFIGSTFAAWEDIVEIRTSRYWDGHVIKVRYGRSIPVPGVTFHDVETLRMALKQRAIGLAGHALLAQSWDRNPAARLPNREEEPVG